MYNTIAIGWVTVKPHPTYGLNNVKHKVINLFGWVVKIPFKSIYGIWNSAKQFTSKSNWMVQYRGLLACYYFTVIVMVFSSLIGLVAVSSSTSADSGSLKVILYFIVSSPTKPVLGT